MLEPLRVGHADEMAAVLADVELYEFTGGLPPSAAELRRRYASQVRGGPAEGGQWWLNWVVRRRADGTAAGYVQATVDQRADGEGAGGQASGGRVGVAPGTAEVAWVIGLRHQGLGLARASVRLVVEWLLGCGVERLVAHVHPGHAASAAVARGVGLAPTSVVVDGEVRWANR